MVPDPVVPTVTARVGDAQDMRLVLKHNEEGEKTTKPGGGLDKMSLLAWR